MSSRWAERENALRQWKRLNLRREIDRTISELQPQQVRMECGAPTRAEQRERASLASSCNNPDHGDPATSKA
jgi:hypothetical protein